jgi:hypothetical protein
MAGDCASSSSSADGVGVEAMKKEVGLKEEDLDDVVFEAEIHRRRILGRW